MKPPPDEPLTLLPMPEMELLPMPEMELLPMPEVELIGFDEPTAAEWALLRFLRTRPVLLEGLRQLMAQESGA